MTEIILPARDYDLAATLDSGQVFRWQRREDSWVGIIGKTPVRLTQRAGGIHAATAEAEADWRELKWFLQTEVDLGKILQTFPDDAPMKAAVAACHGLRVLRQEPWECLASFILSSTKQIVQIRQIVANLCECFGEPIPMNLNGQIGKADAILTPHPQSLSPLRGEGGRDWARQGGCSESERPTAREGREYSHPSPSIPPLTPKVFGAKGRERKPSDVSGKFGGSVDLSSLYFGVVKGRGKKSLAASVNVGGSGDLLYTFPGPGRIAGLSEAQLRGCKMGFRAPNLLAAARRIAEGEINLEKIRGMDYSAARAELMKLRGVGGKIADCVLLFAYGFDSAFPVDVWVERALQQLYFPRRRVGEKKLRHFADTHFGPHAGYAQQYLFHYMRTKLISKRTTT